jgi:voltage-gated potassium channel
MIIGMSGIFYLLESATNSSINNLFDAIWWGFSTATTVGYGDIVPITILGKVLGILLMLMGTALFATYTAMFAQIIIEDEFFRVKLKPDAVEKDDFLEQLKRQKDLLDNQIKHYQKKDRSE